MKLTNISCTQFAGIRDQSISLDNGINIIYGKNESGKSTLVNLISRTLFQDSKIDKRKDKDFFDNFFPTAKKGSNITGDTIDGKIMLEIDNSTYTLTKEWGADSRCILSTPDGVIRDANSIHTILKELLAYGEGVYSDLLFSSQRNTDFSLQTILDTAKKGDMKQELITAISKVFVESNGISIEHIEQAINSKIEEIAGKHWDTERQAPVRKAGGGRHQKQLGKILEAYYALEDAKNTVDNLVALEENAETASANYVKGENALQMADTEYRKFLHFSQRLTTHKEQEKNLERLEDSLNKINNILLRWPETEKNLQAGNILQTKLNARNTLDVYERCHELVLHLEIMQKKSEQFSYPDDDVISSVKKASNELFLTENKLVGINLTASIKMFEGYPVIVKSLLSGKILDTTDQMSIQEAVSITIPGIMEMELAPQDIDINEIEAKREQLSHSIQSVFKEYNVTSIAELENLAHKYKTLQLQITEAKSKLNQLLGNTSYQQLENKAAAIVTPPESLETILAEIQALCKHDDISRFIISCETILSSYQSEYESFENLKNISVSLQADIDSIKENLVTMSDIPTEYAAISNPKEHLSDLENILKNTQVARENAWKEKISATNHLEDFYKNLSENPNELLENATQKFHEQKELLSHWQNIANVFATQKEYLQDNPLLDLANNFSRYLGILSGNRIISEFPDDDKLNITIYSSQRLIDYAKLSEGSKETVSLAFRLAVLDHLFPDGGGIIILDDPCTNMDAERTAQSISLINECAKRHQIIFLTCKEEYLSLLDGHKIHI